MLDKNLLNGWREFQYQKKRIKMGDNVFPCIFEGLEFTLTFKDEKEQILVRRFGRHKKLHFAIHRTEISGYTPADEPGLTLVLTFFEEAEQDPCIFHFHNRDTMLAVASTLEHFLREGVNLSTPPLSSESEDL